MGKRKIIEAAKKKGLTVESAEWVSTVNGNQLRAKWDIRFGNEVEKLYDEDRTQYFSHTVEALNWIDSLEPLPPREEEE